MYQQEAGELYKTKYIDFVNDPSIIDNYPFLNPFDMDLVMHYTPIANNCSLEVNAMHLALKERLSFLKHKNMTYEDLIHKHLMKLTDETEEYILNEIKELHSFTDQNYDVSNLIPYSEDEVYSFHVHNGYEYAPIQIDIDNCIINGIAIEKSEKNIALLRMVMTLTKKEVCNTIRLHGALSLIAQLRVYGNNPQFDTYFRLRASMIVVARYMSMRVNFNTIEHVTAVPHGVPNNSRDLATFNLEVIEMEE